MNLRATSLVLLVALVLPGPALAQADERSVQRVRTALQTESLVGAAAHRWIDPPPRTLGILTFLTPTEPGEIVRVRVPIGELVAGAAHRMSAATRRRQEAAARREVEAALAAFKARQRAP